MGPLWIVTSILTVLVCTAGAPGGGLEAAGNTGGVLQWDLGNLEPGASVRNVVIFGHAQSYEKLVPLLDRAGGDFAEISDPPQTGAGAKADGPVSIRNPVTDFALEPAGRFSSKGYRPALKNQLHQFNYYIHYDDGEAKKAGTPVWPHKALAAIKDRPHLQNLRIVEPVHAISPTQAAGVLETTDGRIRLRVRAAMGRDAAAGVEFILTNIGDVPLTNVYLGTYTYVKCGDKDGCDYCMLDKEVGGLLVVDVSSGSCAAMVGMRQPNKGFTGIWESSSPGKKLSRNDGIEIEQWEKFGGLEGLGKKVPQLILGSMPCPPAPFMDPNEPETRTLNRAEAAALLETDWLFQADNEPTLERTGKEIVWARELAERLLRDPGTRSLKKELAQLQDLENRLARLTGDDAGNRISRLYLAVRAVKRRIMFSNPIVDFSKVLFVDIPYPQGREPRHQARHRDGMMAVPGGRLLVLDGLEPGGRIRKLAPEKPGNFWKPDLSFDAEKVLFCYKAYDDKSFHLYEINIDGTNLKQLTSGDYDDLDPIYLPDGHIMFSTTRCNTYIRCMPYTYCYVLARCDPNGKNVYLVSRNNECDWVPALLNDGRICYSRWEYHDKALWRIQSLWSVNQDGTGTAAFWGNQSVWPDHLAEPSPIPGSSRIMFTGLAHHNWFDGSIGILDQKKGLNFPNGLTKVTCDVAWPECGEPPLDPHESPSYHVSGKYNAYKSPRPLSEQDFLVSARREGPDQRFRLYLMDVHGNRELIYEGAHNILHAIPAKPRMRPPVQSNRVAWPGTGKDRTTPEPGVLFSANVYQGVPDLPRGKAKYVRVIQMDARTYSSWTRDGRFSGPVVSVLQDDGVKRILGTAPIESDGSVSFRVPPGKALHFQLLDEHFRALQTMRSFTGVMPGETRGCVGCHELHSTTSPNKRAMALRKEPVDLTPPPWGAEVSVGYERFVQPVLNTYCGKCHQGDGKGREKLDLTLRPGPGVFKEPYVTLVGKANYSRVDGPKDPGIAGALMAENYDQRDPASYATFPPMQYLSYTSRLIEIAMSGKHHDVKVDPLGLRRLIAWVDTNCPFRGDKEIRQIADPDFPGIEYLPIRPRVKTAPIIARP